MVNQRFIYEYIKKKLTLKISQDPYHLLYCTFSKLNMKLLYNTCDIWYV